MSCTAISNKIGDLAGRLSGAISHLSSRRAFVAGMVVGASGTGLGAWLMTRRRQLAGLFRAPARTVAALPPPRSKPAAKPIPGLMAGEPVTAKAKPIPGVARGRSKKPRPIPGLTKTTAIPAEPMETKLQAGPVKVVGRDGQQVIVPNSYQVIRADGTATGLAITPHLSGNGEKSAGEPAAWSVTHLGTGTMIDGPFESVSQAQGLASTLSSLRWTASTVPPADVAQAKTIIGQYRQSLSTTSQAPDETASQVEE